MMRENSVILSSFLCKILSDVLSAIIIMGGSIIDTMGCYLSGIKRFPRVTRAEEIELAKQMEIGGREAENARRKLIEGNLRLVVYLVKRYRGKFLSDEELVGVGNIGLIKAVDGFDYRRGVSFATYAQYSIRQSILRALHQKSVIHVPFLEPLVPEMVDFDAISYEMAGDEKGFGEIDDSDLAEKINAELAILKGRDLDIVRRRGAESLEAIGLDYGLSRERVRQIEAYAFNKLRKNSKLRQLAEAL